MNVIWMAALAALAVSGAYFHVFRKLTRSQVSLEDLIDCIDINRQTHSPLGRLLDPSEFEFLRKRGLSRQRIQRLRSQRRSLFRMYMRRLAREFNAAYAALQAVLVTAHIDRPDLARELGRQRLLFYRGLIGIEVRLTLNALGFDSVPVPSLELIRPLECLLEFCRLVSALSAAQA